MEGEEHQKKDNEKIRGKGNRKKGEILYFRFLHINYRWQGLGKDRDGLIFKILF